MKKKGFTLIELLVVIAIIGILAAMILVALNAARNRARDASIKSSMKSAQAAVIMCLDTAGSAVVGYAPNGPICNPDNGSDWWDNTAFAAAGGGAPVFVAGPPWTLTINLITATQFQCTETACLES